MLTTKYHLMLIRHGECEQISPKLPHSDKHRELTNLGMRQINHLANFLYNENIIVDKIITSDAQRALQTSNILIEKLTRDPSVLYIEKSIYSGHRDSILDLIKSFSPQHKTIILVGHNPSITEVGEYLVSKMLGMLSPGGIISIKFDENWEKIMERNGELCFLKNFFHKSLTLS